METCPYSSQRSAMPGQQEQRGKLLARRGTAGVAAFLNVGTGSLLPAVIFHVIVRFECETSI